jgi:hypothetical protein
VTGIIGDIQVPRTVNSDTAWMTESSRADMPIRCSSTSCASESAHGDKRAKVRERADRVDGTEKDTNACDNTVWKLTDSDVCPVDQSDPDDLYAGIARMV